MILQKPLLAACLSGLILAQAAGATVLNISWDGCPEAESYLIYWGKQAGQYGSPKVVAASDACQFRLADLEGDTAYFLAMKATSAQGVDSAMSEEVSATTRVDSDGDGMSDDWEQRYGLDPTDPADAAADADGDGASNLKEYNAGSDPTDGSIKPEGGGEASKGGGGGCFIATAAYGSPLASQVGLLKGLRDGWLMRFAPGRAFVRGYYERGPAAARFISASDAMRWMVCAALLPLVVLVGLGLGKAALALAGVALLLRSSRRRS